jgi:hypothetical protein
MATTSNFGLLLVGRFILGFAVALSAIAECIYIAEISTPEKRGLGQFTFLFTRKDHYNFAFNLNCKQFKLLNVFDRVIARLIFLFDPRYFLSSKRLAVLKLVYCDVFEC